MTLAFLLTAFFVVASPGTGVLVTVATGLSRGPRAAIIAAFGCTLGIVPHMLAAVTGLAALLHASALAFETVKFLGVAYLLYMAFATLREKGALDVDGSGTGMNEAGIVRHAVLVNLLNPKLSIFFLAFLPQFVDPAGAAPALAMAGLSAVFMAMTFAVFSVYGVFAATLRRQVLARPAALAWLRRGFAAAFAALGLKLAFTDR